MKCMSITANINIFFSNRTEWSIDQSVFLCPSRQFLLCSALSSACLQSVGHPADTILAAFTRVCWPQPAFVVCILNAQQRGSLLGQWFPETSHLQLLRSQHALRKEDRHKRSGFIYCMDLNKGFIHFVILLWAELLQPIKCFYGFHS